MKGRILAMILSGATIFTTLSGTAFAAENLYGKNPEKTIVFNEDCTDFAGTRANEGFNMENLTAWVDQYVNTDVGALFVNTQAYTANFGGNVVETFWETAGTNSGMAKYAEAIYAANVNGLEFDRIRINLLREKGISPWVSLRMNDIHDSTTAGEEDTTATFKKMHNYTIGSKSIGNESNCLDYNIPAVRAFSYAMVQDNLERFDVDGIELDWMRECYAINDAAYREETRIAINQLVRDIRKLLDYWEVERGHEIKLAVRVPATLHVAENSALDAKTWSSERLVDLVTVTARWSSADTDMPIEEWVKALKTDTGNEDIQIAAGLELLFRSNPYYAPKADSIETASGMAYSYLSRGADCIYLFNHMDRGTKMSYCDTDYIPMLNQIGNASDMLGKVRRHVVTYRDKWASDETPVYSLPANCNNSAAPSFDVHVGNISGVKDNENYYVILGANQNKGGAGAGVIDAAGDCTVTVNGTTCTYAGKANDLREPTPANSEIKFDLVKYAIPASAVQDGYNTVKITCADGTEREITWVEIYVEPKN